MAGKCFYVKPLCVHRLLLLPKDFDEVGLLQAGAIAHAFVPPLLACDSFHKKLSK